MIEAWVVGVLIGVGIAVVFVVLVIVGLVKQYRSNLHGKGD